jgi:hypothetical protein
MDQSCFQYQRNCTVAVILVGERDCRTPLPRICPSCHKHFSVLSSCMTYHRVCNSSNTTGVISGAGTVYPTGPPTVCLNNESSPPPTLISPTQKRISLKKTNTRLEWIKAAFNTNATVLWHDLSPGL